MKEFKNLIQKIEIDDLYNLNIDGCDTSGLLFQDKNILLIAQHDIKIYNINNGQLVEKFKTLDIGLVKNY